MLGILLTLECVATELFYIWRNCHRVLTDLYGLRIIFFLSYKITTKFINILIKRAFNEFAFLFFSTYWNKKTSSYWRLQNLFANGNDIQSLIV